jgi:outer membrane protein OmpA-like peptidoglycan-associated protein
MKLRLPLFVLAFSTSIAHAAGPVAPASGLTIPWWPMQAVAAPQAAATPKTPEEWMTRMTDFTRNSSAYRDPRAFVAWSHAVTEPGFVLTAAKGAMEPGGWLNMMNSMATPDAVKNYMGFSDPNVYLRWMQASMDPAFYTAMLTQFSDPGKMMRWAMMPLDPRVLDVAMTAVNPNTYIRWPMAGMDPRTWNLMGNVMNPALYTSMLGTALNTGAAEPLVNPWLSWRPTNVVGASSPWGADPVASFNMFDPALLGNLAGFVGLPNISVPSLPNFSAGAPMSAQSSVAQAPAPQISMAQAVAPVPAAAPAPAAIQPVATPDNKIILALDTLFKSGKASVRDLSKDGKSKLDDVAARIKAVGVVEQIKIIGHADIMGKADANLKLSERRARAIKSYLVAKGIKPGVIITSGVGDTQPVAECDMKKPKAELIVCLAPNRRVEIEVMAKAKK